MWWLALASLAASAYSTKVQADSAKTAQRYREAQAEEEKKRANIQAVRASREQIKAQRLEAARVANAAAQSGTEGSSGAAGAIAGSSADLASNLNYANVMGAADRRIGELGVGAARANTQGQIWGAYGNLAGTVFSGSGGFTNFRSKE